MLQDFDALLYDRIRFQIADGLKLEEELRGDGVVVERFAVLGGFFPFGVLGFWPERLEASANLDLHVIHKATGVVYHSLTGSSSYQ